MCVRVCVGPPDYFSGSARGLSRWCWWTSRASTSNATRSRSRRRNYSPPSTRSPSARTRWCCSRKPDRAVSHKSRGSRAASTPSFLSRSRRDLPRPSVCIRVTHSYLNSFNPVRRRCECVCVRACVRAERRWRCQSRSEARFVSRRYKRKCVIQYVTIILIPVSCPSLYFFIIVFLKQKYVLLFLYE